MKKLSTLVSSMFIAVLVHGQAITINASDMPVPTSAFNVDDLTQSFPPSPTLGDNQAWDYSSYYGNQPFVNDYMPETNTFFTSAGADVYLSGTKALNASFGYNIDNEYDFNANGVYEMGANIHAQAYSLATFTGSANDSLIFPAAQQVFTTPKTLISFPFTANSSWHSQSSRVTNFFLTVAALGYNNAPGEQRYNYVRNDSIVGWGKMSVYTSSGPSIQYDVLMEQVEQYSVDSFYINGAPANVIILNAFSVTQGQHSNVQYSYNFYRAGSFNYLMRFYYGDHSAFDSLSNAYFNTDNISLVKNVDKDSYSAVVFPNPANGNVLNIKIMGHDFNLTNYSIVDMKGKVVQQGIIEKQSAGQVQINVGSYIANGSYFLKAKDSSNKEVVSQEINLMR